MRSHRPLVTALVASAGALAVSTVTVIALSAAPLGSSVRVAEGNAMLPTVALKAPLSLDASMGVEPALPTPEPTQPAARSYVPPTSPRASAPAPAPPSDVTTHPTPSPTPSMPPASPAPTPTPNPEQDTPPSPTPAPTPEESTEPDEPGQNVDAPADAADEAPPAVVPTPEFPDGQD